jgi:predicted TIM-barrel fold metal-dependent hydrolase
MQKTSSPSLAMPNELRPFAGEILDVDTHESLPINLWVDRYGSLAQPFVDAVIASGLPAKDTRDHDDTEINAETVWNVKRINAPGAFDMRRRLDVLNLTGVKRQMIFPGAMGLLSVVLLGNAENRSIFATLGGDRRAYARQLLNAYNEWAIRTTNENSDRYRPVAVLIGETPDDLLADARSLVKRGIRGLWMPTSEPPGGISPAHTLLDPLWDLLQSSDIPLTAHVGADHRFLKSDVWRKAPAFEGFKMGDEFSLDPWSLASNHRPTESFLTTLVLGGVFERFPKLRYGISEFGANWIGPLCQHLDMWIENSGIFIGKSAKKPELRMRPSEYIHRNVRISPFDFEDVGSYIKRYGMPELYCYASDFPHLEGGKNPMGDLARSLRSHGLGDDVFRKVFVENGKWLLPN